MRNRHILLAAAAAIVAVPAFAQVGAEVGADVGADVGGAVSDTVDTAQDAMDTATDTAADAASQAGDAAPGAQVEAAAAADVKAGAQVRDTDGNVVGTVESVDGNGAVISTGESRVQIPVSSFGKDADGLVIALSKAELDAAAKGAADPG